MTHAPAVRGCFLPAPIVRTFARILSAGSQTTYSRMKVEVVGGGERMWQGTMSRAMRSKNGKRRWHHRVRKTLPPFMLGNLGFLARLYAVRQKGIAPETCLFTWRGYLPGLQTTLGTGRRCP
jgi:hypothetical protein